MDIKRIISAVRHNFKAAWDDRISDLTGEHHEACEHLNELIQSKRKRESKSNEDSKERNPIGGRHTTYVA